MKGLRTAICQQFPGTFYLFRLERISVLICFHLAQTSCWHQELQKVSAKSLSVLASLQLCAIQCIKLCATRKQPVKAYIHGLKTQLKCKDLLIGWQMSLGLFNDLVLRVDAIAVQKSLLDILSLQKTRFRYTFILSFSFFLFCFLSLYFSVDCWQTGEMCFNFFLFLKLIMPFLKLLVSLVLFSRCPIQGRKWRE